MGRPIIQLPEDMVVIQEVVYRVKPDVIVETGVAHGGSLVSTRASAGRWATEGSLGSTSTSGRATGRPSNPTSSTLASRSSKAARLIRPRSPSFALTSHPTIRCWSVLDSDHSKSHVLAELDAYAPLVTPGSYLVATDGVMEWLTEVPGVSAEWLTDNPKAAVEEWLPLHPEFVLEDPPPIPFNEGAIIERVTHWPSGLPAPQLPHPEVAGSGPRSGAPGPDTARRSVPAAHGLAPT